MVQVNLKQKTDDVLKEQILKNVNNYTSIDF